ncbi:MAG: methylamine dehydrogenase accessory protein MauD [Myxococcota bacterium]
MDDALILSNLLLWGVVAALAAVVLALLRQIGVLHERISPAGALVGRENPRVGEEAPVLALSDWNERALTVGGPSAEGRGTLLLFTSPTCPVCRTLLPQLRSICAAEDRDIRLIVASDGPRSEHVDFVREHDLERDAYVLSADLGIAYQVGRLPYAVLLDELGVVRARGLVNTREHLESLFEARSLGVASLQEFASQEEGKRRVA